MAAGNLSLAARTGRELSLEVPGHGLHRASIREKARIDERPRGLVMTIEVYASYDGWVSVNDRPVTSRGDEAATWSAAHVIVGAHLVNLARELTRRRPAQLPPEPPPITTFQAGPS